LFFARTSALFFLLKKNRKYRECREKSRAMRCSSHPSEKRPVRTVVPYRAPLAVPLLHRILAMNLSTAPSSNKENRQGEWRTIPGIKARTCSGERM